MPPFSILLRYSDGTLDIAYSNDLISASSLARDYARSTGVVRATVYDGAIKEGRVVTRFLAGGVLDAAVI